MDVSKCTQESSVRIRAGKHKSGFMGTHGVGLLVVAGIYWPCFCLYSVILVMQRGTERAPTQNADLVWQDAAQCSVPWGSM